jgi:rhodanese-related sulfurtransferase
MLTYGCSIPYLPVVFHDQNRGFAMIHSVIRVALMLQLDDLVAWATRSPGVAISLSLSGLALLILFLMRLRRLPSTLRARHSPTLDPLQMEELMIGNPPQIIDLREPREFLGPRGHIRGSTNIPSGELARRIHELDTSPPRPIVLVDETDQLSHQVLPILAAQGHPWIYVLKGGFRAWQHQKLPVYKAGTGRTQH